MLENNKHLSIQAQREFEEPYSIMKFTSKKKWAKNKKKTKKRYEKKVIIIQFNIYYRILTVYCDICTVSLNQSVTELKAQSAVQESYDEFSSS